jgi:hypothetical protein
MARLINVNEPGQHPEKLYGDDGLMDILLGVVFLGAALAMQYEVVWLLSILPIAVLVLWPSIKQFITAPRLTHEEIQAVTQLAETNRQRNLIVLYLLVGMLVLGLAALMAFQADAAWMDNMWPFVLMGVGLLVIALPGFAFGTRRFYFYTAATFALWLLCYWLAVSGPTAVALPGVLLLTGGSYHLQIFLRTHPKIR